jgi:hypothetical protein
MLKSMRILKVFATGVACTVGCASVALPVNVTTYHQSLALPSMPRPLDTMPEQYRDEASGLIEATYDVIRSPEFASNLLETRGFLGLLWLGPGGDKAEQSVVAAAYLGQDANHPLLPAMVEWSGAGGNVKGGTDIINIGRSGQIVLDAQTRERWRSTDVMKKSCAINTLAHEMTHVVALHPGVNNNQMFVDRGRSLIGCLDRPLVSYVVGAVAQCTYIAKQGAGHEPLEACIHKRGTNILNEHACD